jgi:hypothetical protein
MPDGFDPHRELARIYTLQELMTECRARTPKIMALADDMLDDPTLSADTKLRVMEFVVNRGFGKPRQHVVINEPGQHSERKINPVKVYIPDNRRQLSEGPIIDVGQEDDA